MTIGQIEFTSTNYVNSASADTDDVMLEFTDDKIQVFRGSGAKRLFLPPPKESNSYGEVWIVNDQSADHAITVDGDGENGSGASKVSGKGKTTTGSDVSIGQNKAAHFRYVPQRVKYNYKKEAVPEGTWVPVLSA